MRIVEPSFEILNISSNEMLELIEVAGRTCYKSEDSISEDSAKDFCRKILKRGHESVIEHAVLTVRIICDRGVSHEIVRHRIASYSQESTRYCNYGKDEHITFIKPCFFPNIVCKEYINIDDLDLTNFHVSEQESLWLYAMDASEHFYNKLIQRKCSPQEARSVLPNSLKTEIVMTCNLREWRHFFKLRTSKSAHPQMREIARPMLEEFKMKIPVLFDDINY